MSSLPLFKDLAIARLEKAHDVREVSQDRTGLNEIGVKPIELKN
jgi:hypothetical protein